MKHVIYAALLICCAALPADAFRVHGSVSIPVGGGGGGSQPFTALHTYFMSPTGSDGNNGLSAASPWATPNHSVVCGDVIIAASGAYSSAGINNWGTVANCPSTTGGIDGAGGVNFATLLCGGASVGDCNINYTGTPGLGAMTLDTSNWAVSGWRVTAASGGRSYNVRACNSGTQRVHHVAVVNSISTNSNAAFDTNECALNHNVPGNGSDYLAFIGSIAHNSNNDSICLAAIDAVAPAPWDSVAGTHIYFAGNFAIANLQNGGCSSDGEAIMFDTWDAHGFTGQGVIANNIIYSSAWANTQVFMQGFNSSSPVIKLYNNTSFNGSASMPNNNASVAGDMNHQLDGGFPWTLRVFNNISKTNRAIAPNAGGGESVYALHIGGASGPSGQTIAIGGTGLENIANGVSGQNTISFNGYSMGANFTTNPLFKNTDHLLASNSGTPNCSGFETATACMGWNHATRTATALSVIDDLTPTAANAAGKGYQPPGDCAADADYPVWLKGIVYLHWDGAALTQKTGLVRKPCGL